MKVIKIIVDEVPKECYECVFCVQTKTNVGIAPICFADDLHTPARTLKRAGLCRLTKEDETNERSQ